MAEVEYGIEVSIIAPAHSEEDNVDALVQEIVAAMEPIGCAYEIIVVDDGSTDRTLDRLRDLAAHEARLRVLRMRETPVGRGHGQSAAFCAAFRAARGEIIAMLDADLQNDPADIPKLLEEMRETGADLVQGQGRVLCQVVHGLLAAPPQGVHPRVHNQPAGPPHLVAQAPEVAVGIFVHAHLDPEPLGV